MTYNYWESVPLDIIRQELEYFNTLDEVRNFCGDPIIFERVCQDENGKIWQDLFKRDFSDEIHLDRGKTVMQQYFEDKEKINKLNNINLLAFIAKKGYEKVLHRLNLSKISDTDKYQAVFDAAAFGRLPIIVYLVENKEIILTDVILYVAASNGYLPLVEYLIKKGVNIHGNNEDILYRTIFNGHLNVAEYLISQGANLDYVKNELLNHINNVDSLKFLLRNNTMIESDEQLNLLLKMAIVHENLPMIKYLNELGANLRVGNDRLLLYAVRTKNFPIIQYLIEKKLDPNILDNVVIKSLLEYKNLHIIRYLLEHGLDLYKYDMRTFEDAIHDGIISKII